MKHHSHRSAYLYTYVFVFDLFDDGPQHASEVVSPTQPEKAGYEHGSKAHAPEERCWDLLLLELPLHGPYDEAVALPVHVEHFEEE